MKSYAHRALAQFSTAASLEYNTIKNGQTVKMKKIAFMPSNIICAMYKEEEQGFIGGT